MNTEQNDSQAELAAWEILAETRQKLEKATQQLTKANETIGTMIDQIGMLQLKDKATTEQRDRLTEIQRMLLRSSCQIYPRVFCVWRKAPQELWPDQPEPDSEPWKARIVRWFHS
jgi:hypothetical protein